MIWIESGLAWVPFLMQRLDHEYMMRTSDCPTLKQRPSEYMREMYYSTQPMEVQDMEALQCTFRMINAETQLLYSSDYPHWDFDLPSVDLRPAVPDRQGQAQHPRRHGRAPVQAAAAQREAEGEPRQVRQPGGVKAALEPSSLYGGPEVKR